MGVGTFAVEGGSLGEGAALIALAAQEVQGALGAVVSAASASGAFGGEPAGAGFAAMTADAERALTELHGTIAALSDNAAAASAGYITTDEGVVPLSHVPNPPRA